MKYKDYYKILGIERNATKEQIKKAYRNLAKKHHPDTHPGDKVAEDTFKEVNEAYKVLIDDDKRQKYDTFGNNVNFNNGYDFDPSQFGWSGGSHTYETGNGFSDFFHMFSGDDGINLSDLFGGRTGNGRNIRFNTGTQGFDFNNFGQEDMGRNTEAEIAISVKDAYQGKEQSVSLRREGSPVKNYRIKIPAGIKDGQKIRMKGQGINGGDLLVKVNIRDSEFELEGLNVIREVDILPWEAVLGSKITVPVIDGSRLSVKMPEGISSGGRIRITKKGYRDSKGNIGDYYLKIKIIIPKDMTDKEKSLYEELKRISKTNVRR